MKAVRAVAPGRIEVLEVPDPEGPGVLVEPSLVGICGTDVKVLEGRIPVPYPLIMGHEAVGRVRSVPAGSDLHPGERVLIDPAVTCGRCRMCRAGRPNICLRGGLLGRDLDGVFAQQVRIPEARLLPIPPQVSEAASGLLQVLGTCVHAQRAVEVFPGQTVAVIGLGVAGQLMVQLLRERGVAVVGITRSAWKLDLARRHGAVAVATPDRAAEVLEEVTEGRGPELVVEAAGTERTLGQAIELVAVGGEVLVFGTTTAGSEGLPYYQLYYKELTIRNPRAAMVGDYATGIDLVASGRLQLEPLVTHQLGLEEAEDAFRAVEDPAALKVLMRVA